MKTLTRSLLVFGWALTALPTLAKPYVIKSDGTRVEGESISGAADGTVTLMTAQGKFDFKSGQYKEAANDKPAEFDAADPIAYRPDQPDDKSDGHDGSERGVGHAARS